MILDFCITRGDDLDMRLTLEALDRNDAVLGRHGAPLGVGATHLHAVLLSGLVQRVAKAGQRLVNGREIPHLSSIQRPNPAEYARLISKGRLLYEHCMTEVSHWCIVGFMEHELKKSRTAERVVLDLLGWMVEQRVELDGLAEVEGEEAVRRCAHTDYMIDHGVSFLHGFDRDEAAHLAADKEPDDA
jgi:hypothetical protein